MKKIQILLSTYNGEAYLREQLDSFAALLNFDEVKVLIRDDGSTDSTAEILNEYREKYGFEVIFGENAGLNKSFHLLAEMADRECEYFAFADQDDVWLPCKLKRAVDFLSNADSSVKLYCACSQLVDSELKPLGHTLIPKKPASFYNAMVQNVAVGHTQVFRRDLLLLLSREFSDHITVTDHWNYLLASSLGEVFYDAEKTTLYRQHGKNVIGYKSSAISKLKTRIRRVFSDKPKENTRQLEAFLSCYSEDMRPEHRRELEFFLRSQESFFKRLFYLFKTRVYRQTIAESLIFRIMYLIGRYKLSKKRR